MRQKQEGRIPQYKSVCFPPGLLWRALFLFSLQATNGNLSERTVEVEVKFSGQDSSFLVVRDNGRGMDASDLQAFATYFLSQVDLGRVKHVLFDSSCLDCVFRVKCKGRVRERLYWLCGIVMTQPAGGRLHFAKCSALLIPCTER